MEPPMIPLPDSGGNGNIGVGSPALEVPIPLDTIDTPPFPIKHLPGWIREWVASIAEATQTPWDLAAMSALGVLSASVAKKYRVEVWPGWTEPLNLMLLTGLPSGNRKSPVFAAATAPIYAFEKDHHAEWQTAYQLAMTNFEIAEKALRRAQDAAAKVEGTEAQDARGKAQEAAKAFGTMRKPTFPRLVADDATPEKIVSLLAEQGGRIGIFSAEGGLFSILAGRYSESGPILDAVLKGHSGDPIRVDRVGRPSESVQSPALTICLAVQPSVVKDLSQTPAFSERGLTARFLYAIPISKVGHRAINPPQMSETIRLEFEANVKWLLSLPEDRGEDGEIESRKLCLSPLASAELSDFMAELEPRLRPEGDLATLADWAGKLAGTVARIGALFHLAAHTGHEIPQTISEMTIREAIGLAPYLIAHARSAYQLLGGGHVNEARRILDWIRRAKVSEFSRSQCWQGVRGRIKKAADLDAPLLLLKDHGYIRPAASEPTPRPGRPPERFEVNPLSHNPQNP
jgi:hypothetical protein